MGFYRVCAGSLFHAAAFPFHCDRAGLAGRSRGYGRRHNLRLQSSSVWEMKQYEKCSNLTYQNCYCACTRAVLRHSNCVYIAQVTSCPRSVLLQHRLHCSTVCTAVRHVQARWCHDGPSVLRSQATTNSHHFSKYCESVNGRKRDVENDMHAYILILSSPWHKAAGTTETQIHNRCSIATITLAYHTRRPCELQVVF